MKIIQQSYEILTDLSNPIETILKPIERAARTCFVPNTEILTNSGWKFINNITEDDLILTYDPDKNTLIYDKPNIIKNTVSQQLVEINHPEVKLCVTGDHRIYQSAPYNRNYTFLTANQLLGITPISKSNQSRFRIPKYFINSKRLSQNNLPPIIFKENINCGFLGYKEKQIELPINEDLMVILGAYISEGHACDNSKHKSGSYCQITQTENTELYKSVLQSLNNLNIPYKIYADPRKSHIKWIHFGNSILYVHLFNELCGSGSYNKHLPVWFRELPDNLLNILINNLYLGDGSNNKTRTSVYISMSKRLLDELQECFILLGKCAHVHYNEKIKTQRCCAELNRDSWIIQRNKHIKQTDIYTGDVYCTSTKTGIICIRYKDTVCWCGNCYKSEDRITDDSCLKMCKMLIERDHTAMLEHSQLSVKFITNRAIANEIVRHRIASYAQVSTRYCNYSKDKFGNEIQVIEPNEDNLPIGSDSYNMWYQSCKNAEDAYMTMLSNGIKPEIARDVLPLSLATEIVVTTNVRSWRNIFYLRTSKFAHPQIRSLMKSLLNEFKSKIPVLFDDIDVD